MAKRVKSKTKSTPESRRNCGTYSYRHDWKSLGNGERIRRWPSEDDPRKIRIHIHTFVGTCAIGAKHISVTIEEEKNQWWCEEDNCWVELSCDSGSRDHDFRGEVLQHKDAQDFAAFCVAMIKASNPKQIYRVTTDDDLSEEDEFEPDEDP